MVEIHDYWGVRGICIKIFVQACLHMIFFFKKNGISFGIFVGLPTVFAAFLWWFVRRCRPGAPFFGAFPPSAYGWSPSAHLWELSAVCEPSEPCIACPAMPEKHIRVLILSLVEIQFNMFLLEFYWQQGLATGCLPHRQSFFRHFAYISHPIFA